ncbi:MAG: bifunctional DNA primase/polymerase [Alphaproteobacteria bacterium]
MTRIRQDAAIPCAPISPNSQMKGLGKTPSHYNVKREVVGIAKWTEKVVTEANVAAWRNEPDFGICVRTGGGLYGIDIDIEDPDAALSYASQLVDRLGLDHFVYRCRPNSGRLLLPIWYMGHEKGNDPKFCSMVSPDGAVDLLGEGKQFVAFGTHPSGVRYEWRSKLLRRSERYVRIQHYYDASDLV